MLVNRTGKSHIALIIQYFVIAAVGISFTSSHTYADNNKRSKNSWLSVLVASHKARLGRPFTELQEQIDALNAQLAILEAEVDEQLMSTVPVEVTVDCGLGESVTDVLDQYRFGTAPLTINITGRCQEIAIILRDRVTLQGVSPIDGFTAVSGVFGVVTVSRGAKDVTLRNLTITSASPNDGLGLIATKNSHVTVVDTTFEDFGTGVLTLDSAFVEITGSTITNNLTGVSAARNSNINLSNSILDNNRTGFAASSSSVVNLFSLDPSGTAVDGVVVNSTSVGGSAATAGALLISNSEINALNVGVDLSTSAVAQISSTSISNNVIGVQARKNTSVVFGPINTFNNNGQGVNCDPDASYQVIIPITTLPGTMNGNGEDVVGCTDF